MNGLLHLVFDSLHLAAVLLLAWLAGGFSDSSLNSSGSIGLSGNSKASTLRVCAMQALCNLLPGGVGSTCHRYVLLL